MRSTLLTSAVILSTTLSVFATHCVVFDSEDKVYFFGVSGGDGIASAESAGWRDEGFDRELSFTAPSGVGRPPFDGENTQCYLSHYINALYVLNGDKANPLDVHIYDVVTNRWSTQKVTQTASGPTPNLSTAITALDHNTNVFYSLDLDSGGTLFNLKIGDATPSTPLSWDISLSLSFNSPQKFSSSTPAPNIPCQSRVFVIHYNYEQPELTTYNGASFPAVPGTGIMMFQRDMQPSPVFGFIPLDASATYLIDTNTNTSTAFAGPPMSGDAVKYAAGSTHIMAVSAEGRAAFLSISGGDWTSVPALEKRVVKVGAGGGATTTVGETGGVATGTVVVTSGVQTTVPATSRVVTTKVSSGALKGVIGGLMGFGVVCLTMMFA
ncbi:hypothetical protein BC829DRAFT_441930 [Chytridium lagenaria]|nr:hypothetical protein BC829DRAFT_441930 [Chytridium lagenaria]